LHTIRIIVFIPTATAAWAQIGFTTTILESVATSVGAGMVLGGFVFGVFRLIRGQSSEERQRRALVDGYAGGLFAIGLLIFDSAMRYVV